MINLGSSLFADPNIIDLLDLRSRSIDLQRLVTFIYRRLRNILTYLLTYLLTPNETSLNFSQNSLTGVG